MARMSVESEHPSLDDLLSRATWARRLARHLVRREDEADDLLQEAWLVAAAKVPPDQRPSRGWLAGVLRMLGMRQARAVGRRRQREAEAGAVEEAPSPGADHLLEQVETQ